MSYANNFPLPFLLTADFKTSFPFSLCHCLVTHFSTSDSFTTMTLYKFTYILTYLL